MKNINTNDYYTRIKELNISHYTGEVPYYTRAPLREVEKKLITSIPKRSKILDVGCGSGRFSIRATQSGHTVIGIDVTPAAIAAASEKARNLKLNNVNFLVGDMTEMKLRDNEFDHVFCPRFSINAVATFQKRKKAVSEMIRVVKPGGLVYVESFNKLYLGRGLIMPAQNIFNDLRRRTLMILCRLRDKEYTGLLPGDITYESNKVAGAPRGYAHLPTIFELKKLLPIGISYKFYSIPQVLGGVKFDLFKYVRYSIWIFLTKPN